MTLQAHPLTRALVLLLLAIVLSPSAFAATIDEAAKLVHDGKYKEAIGVYDSILSSASSLTAADARYGKGLALKALRRYPEAVACWEDLIKPGFRNPRQEEALLETAKTRAFDMNQPSTALKFYDRFFKSFPASKLKMEARYQQCGTYYQLGDFKQAKSRFETFLRDFPESYLNPEVRRMVALCDANLTPVPAAPKQETKRAFKPSGAIMEDTAEKLNQALEKADQLLASQQHEKALKAYMDVRRAFPLSNKDEKALFLIGKCHAALGRHDKAAAAWNELALKSRGNPESEYADACLLALGNLHLNAMGDPKKALPYYETLLRTMPESSFRPEANHQLGLIYLYQGKLSEALAIFEKERESNPQDTNAPPDSLTRLIEACKGARSYTPDFTETPQGIQAASHIRRGDVFFTAKEYGKARKAYEEAERLAPGTEEGAYAIMQAGRCWNQLGQFRKALRCYEPFLKQYQNSSWADDALLRAGVIHVGPLNDAKSGAKLYRTILERYPRSNEADRALLNLGLLACWGSNRDEAKSLFQRLIEDYPNSPYITYVQESYLAEMEEDQGIKKQTNR